MASSRLTELHHGGSQDMGEPNHHRKHSPRSESDSEDELDLIGLGLKNSKENGRRVCGECQAIVTAMQRTMHIRNRKDQ